MKRRRKIICGAPTKVGGQCQSRVKVAGHRCWRHARNHRVLKSVSRHAQRLCGRWRGDRVDSDASQYRMATHSTSKQSNLPGELLVRRSRYRKISAFKTKSDEDPGDAIAGCPQ